MCVAVAAAVDVVVWQPFIAMKRQNLLQHTPSQNGIVFVVIVIAVVG